jgi:P4 family phage/plasmid primase-like protien
MFFDTCVRFGVNFKNGDKKSVKFKKNWQNTIVSSYNNESHFAVLTGEINDILVIDLDFKEEKFLGLQWFEKVFGDITEMDTLVTKTNGNGYHIYFKYNEKIPKKIQNKQLYIDILSTGNCCFQGETYPVISEKSIRKLSDTEIQEILFLGKRQGTPSSSSNDFNSDDNLTPCSPCDLWSVLDNLGESRYTTYDDWIKVGFALKHEENGLELFDRFSKKNMEKYDKNVVLDKWKTFSTDKDSEKITKGTLYAWLKEDNFEKFKELSSKKKDTSSIINEIYKKNHNDGKIINSKADKKGGIVGTVVDNKEISDEHYISNKCVKALQYSVDVDKSVTGQINSEILCTKCGYNHKDKCTQNQYIYQLIINNNNVNTNDLSIVIDTSKQLIIHKDPLVNAKLYQALTQSDRYIVEALYLMYKNEYMIVKGKWYRFNGVIWEQQEETNPVELLKNIDKLTDLVQQIYEKHDEAGNLHQDELSNLKKISANVIKNMGKNYNDTAYVTTSKKHFVHTNVTLDSNRELLAFKNGIYDLGKFEFRGATLEDYLTIQLDYDYSPTVCPEKTELVQKFLSDILPSKNVKDYLLTNISICLLGRDNKEQDFFILTGKRGSNGKSLLARLISNLFGIHCVEPEPTLFTKVREKSNETNESVINLVGKRIAIMSEPSKEDKIMSDTLKKMTGGDRLSARALHSKTQVIRLQMKFFMLCNTIPLLDDCKDAEQRRLKIVDFPTRFCETPRLKNEKKIDIGLEDKLIECTNEFFHILIKYLKVYLTLGRKMETPDEVKLQLQKYTDRNHDGVESFFKDKIISNEETKNNRIFCKDVWAAFTEWHEESNGDKIKIIKKDFEYITESYFNLEEKKKMRHNNINSIGWIGIGFKQS